MTSLTVFLFLFSSSSSSSFFFFFFSRPAVQTGPGSRESVKQLTRKRARKCCFTSTETIRLIRDGEPRTATSTFAQLLSSNAVTVNTSESLANFCFSDLVEVTGVLSNRWLEFTHLSSYRTAPDAEAHPEDIRPHPARPH